MVGNPPAGLAVSGGNSQTGGVGTTLSQALAVTLTPGQSGGTASGASILFTTSAGTLSNGTASGSKVIAVTAVNDVFVMTEWKKASGAEGKIEFLADGNGDFAKALDLTMDGSQGGLGLRSKRYSMLVEDGIVKRLNIEEMPGKVDVSGADALIAQL